MLMELSSHIIRELTRWVPISHHVAWLSFRINEGSPESGLVGRVFRVIVRMSEGLCLGTIPS